ncbi:hypothetical protein Q4Q39_19920 [Flavivirga amylovorans]|uniref:DUF1735 domain-containing protein n=1 Tax=Flavivirga amylovorans TaxID=870486 RepID=A0ABT8X7L0_9FLAO|nr:hypothetical protein [Flavivirga amylovorans]MDO5989678.1 hypothetical protein [Flavivirga amylovorans]
MNKIFDSLFIFSIAVIMLFSSCRTEERELIEAPEDEVLVANSNIADLMLKTVSNDGSNDNIIDKSNCFNINLPLTVTANSQEININSKEDYKIIEYIFDEEDDDIDALDITYPITISLEDHSKVTINNATELSSYSNDCKGENEQDDDIECLDFKYPITASVFNTNNELIDTIAANSDNSLFELVNNLSTSDYVTINFPITVILFDETELSINNLVELETTIETYNNDCDEDDDYDYNDDDCDDCDPNQLTNVLTTCADWTVDKLERDSNDLDNEYAGYKFNFFTDGSLSVSWASTTVFGTWTASGIANGITVTINVPSLPYCNNDWILHEISKYSETKIDLRVGGDDRLRYDNGCN